MKQYDVISLVRRFLMPVLLMLLGAVLVINPDAASVLISKCIGYVLIAASLVSGISAIVSARGRFGKSAASVILAIAGGWLTAHPLFLVAWISRVLGVLLLVNGILDLLYARRQGRGILLHALEAGIGAVLILLPMAASRLVFVLVGVVVLVIGILMLLDRLRDWRLITDGNSDIIDAL